MVDGSVGDQEVLSLVFQPLIYLPKMLRWSSFRKFLGVVEVGVLAVSSGIGEDVPCTIVEGLNEGAEVRWGCEVVCVTVLKELLV